MTTFTLALPFIMAVANRIRGAGIYLWKIPLHTTTKIILPMFLATLICPMSAGFIPFMKHFVPMLIAYRVGELWGWGKWVGGILSRCQYFEDNQDGNGEGKNSGIYFLTSLFINEEKDFLPFCRLALAIRGVYWWLPVLSVFFFTNTVTGAELAVSTLVLAVWFPLSCEIGRFFSVRIDSEWYQPKEQGTIDSSELIYGFIQGIVFMILMW